MGMCLVVTHAKGEGGRAISCPPSVNTVTSNLLASRRNWYYMTLFVKLGNMNMTKGEGFFSLHCGISCVTPSTYP
jgi:hypothetical protein